MSGFWVRRKATRRACHHCGPPHRCDLPPTEAVGDIWECFDCRRRWVVCWGNPDFYETDIWKRRLLPWPRYPAVTTDLQDLIDAEMPHAGPCAFCGSDDKRHRVLDAIAASVRSGGMPGLVADDYGISVELAKRIGAEWR